MKIAAFPLKYSANACRKHTHARFGRSDSEETVEEIVDKNRRRTACHLHRFIGDQRLF
jgi:hypothetical protein